MFSISIFMISISLLKFPLSSSTLLPSSLSILITRVLNYASNRLLFSSSFSSFYGALFCSFNWDMFYCLTILATFLCFFPMYYVGLLCLLVLGGWSHVADVLWGPVSQSSLATWAKCFSCIPCMGCVCLPAVLEPWLLSACQWEGLTLEMIGCENWPVRGWLYKTRFTLAGFWCLPSLPFGCIILRSSPGWCSSLVWYWAPEVPAPEHPERRKHFFNLIFHMDISEQLCEGTV